MYERDIRAERAEADEELVDKPARSFLGLLSYIADYAAHYDSASAVEGLH